MKRINENALAKAICSREGGAVNTNIGQVKDVTKAVLDELAKEVDAGNASGVLELCERHLAMMPICPS